MFPGCDKCKPLVKQGERPHRSFTRVSCFVISESNNREYFKGHTAAARILLLNVCIEGKLAYYNWQTFLSQYICHSISGECTGASIGVSILTWGTVEWRTGWASCTIDQLQCYFHSVYCTGSSLVTLVVA